MEYTYEIDNNNKVTITQTENVGSRTSRNTLTQPNSLSGGAPWTREEAEQWAEATIQAIKDNNDIFAISGPIES